MTTAIQKEKIVGIDLGTTNSVIAIMEGATPVVLQNSEGFRTTPSVVAFSSDNEIVVGQIAKRQNILNAENTFYSIKRFIGLNYDEVSKEVSRVPYKVYKDSNGKIKLFVPKHDKSFSPEEISALVLKKLCQDASKALKEDITKAVITVPAYFNDSQRLATKDAGTIAGLDVLRILNEPTAAALAYGMGKNKNETILIFDLGGGTFDVSILEVGGDVFEVLATSGDTHLGGDDFDQIICSYILDEFQKEYNIDLRLDKQALQRLVEASEKAKIELSTLQSTDINIPFIYFEKAESTPRSINLKLTRAHFESMSKQLLNKCRGPVLKALEDAKLSKSDIGEVILVGGSTRIPSVRQLVLDLIGKTLNETVNPDEVVGLGAAVQAGILAGEITDMVLLDVTPLSLGVETTGGLMSVVIKRNTSIPTKQSEVYTTAVDYQTHVDIHVLQGERSLAADNKSLGLFRLENLPKYKKGEPQIEVTFQLDSDGLLSVTAKEASSGKEQSISIQGASVLSRDEVSKMLEDAEKNLTYDRAKKIASITAYEIDFALEKCELLLSFLLSNNYFNLDSSEIQYFKQNILRTLELYHANDFSNNMRIALFDMLYSYYTLLSATLYAV